MRAQCGFAATTHRIGSSSGGRVIPELAGSERLGGSPDRGPKHSVTLLVPKTLAVATYCGNAATLGPEPALKVTAITIELLAELNAAFGVDAH